MHRRFSAVGVKPVLDWRTNHHIADNIHILAVNIHSHTYKIVREISVNNVCEIVNIVRKRVICLPDFHVFFTASLGGGTPPGKQRKLVVLKGQQFWSL